MFSMEKSFKRILELVKKTGDRMIVTDHDGENAYVVMDLEQYELIWDAVTHPEFEFEEEIDVQKTEEEVFIPEENTQNDQKKADSQQMTEIEQEIPVNKQGIEAPKGDSPDVWDVMHDAKEDGQTWDLSKLSDQELAQLEEQYKAFANKGVQEAIEQTKEDSNEPEKKDQNDDFSEEQFYLEPVE